MSVPRVYLEMLKDIGVDVSNELKQQPSVEIDQQRQRKKRVRICCAEPYIVLNQPLGQYWCENCGLIHDNQVYISELFVVCGKSIPIPGKQCSTTITRKRWYQPLTHFKEHLRRYMGARYRNLPDDMINKLKQHLTEEDFKQPDAYKTVQKVLKTTGYNKFYKEIFTIIYHCGGINPKLDHRIYDDCIRDFKYICTEFMQNRTIFGRHSMPSLYMMMDILLRRNNHIPHYNIPQLKDVTLRERVVDIIDRLSQ
jgi:hypothetical protein